MLNSGEIDVPDGVAVPHGPAGAGSGGGLGETTW